MGFFPRLFSSLRGRKDKSKSKPASQAPPPQPARRTISENELLRMSSRNASVYSQIDFLDPNAPPMPHPINDVTRANSRASSYLDRQPSYKVHVHEPQPRSRSVSARSDMPPPPPHPPTRKPVPRLDVGPVTPPRQTAQPPPILSPEDARQLQRLRSDANLSNLMALYATHGAQPRDLDEQFRNTPARDRDRERKQRNRASTDLRSLLHASPAKDSDEDEDESGDVLAWADKLIDATMLDANPDPDASFLPLPEPEQDEELYFSSLIAEVGSADAHSPSLVRLDSDMAPVQVAPDDAREKAQLTRSGSVRASLVFDFLLRKEDQQARDRDDVECDHDRSLRRSASTGSTVLFSSTTRTAPVPPAKDRDRDERALFRHSTTSVTMLQPNPNATVARHDTAVPYPAVSTRPLRTSTNGNGAGNGARVSTSRQRTSSIPLLVPSHTRASSLRYDHEEPVTRGGRPASSLGLYDPDPQPDPDPHDRVPERQTSVKQLASKFNAASTAPPKRIGGPRAMRAPSPVKQQRPRDPLRTSNRDRDEAENPFVVQQQQQQQKKKGAGRTLSLKELGYDEVHEGQEQEKEGEKENMRVHYPYAAQEHTPTKPLPLPLLHLDAPSPAPSRASSSEMSPIGQKFQYDARLKAAGSRVWR